MSQENRKLSVFIAMSLDGFIAKEGDDLSFLSIVEKEGEEYGYSAFYNRMDTVLMGRKTYDWVCSATGTEPHSDKKLYVFTRQKDLVTKNPLYYTGEIVPLIQQLKKEAGLGIFCDGGAEIVQLVKNNQLVDEWIISIIPVFLGSGVRLFDGGAQEEELELISSQSYETGLVQLHYSVKRKNK